MVEAADSSLYLKEARRAKEEMEKSERMVSPRAPPLPGHFNGRKSDEASTTMRRGYSCVATSTRDMWDMLFNNGYLADMRINTEGDKVIPAHSSILGMASPVLKKMARQERGRVWKRSISIRGVPHQAVRVFIRYLYSSCYEKEEMNEFVLHLLVLSHAFAIPSLKQLCIRELEKGLLTTDNVVDIYQLARLCDAPRLCLLCYRMIIERFKVVSASEGWKVMKQSNPSLEKELLESVVETHSTNQERTKKKEEKKIYLQLYEAMEALVHICREGCRTIGPHDQVLDGSKAPCNFPACKGLELLVRHFAGCKTRVPGGCIHCKRMWQLLELHSRMCDELNSCKVPLCRHFKDKVQHQNKKEEVKWRLLVSKVLGAKKSQGCQS